MVRIDAAIFSIVTVIERVLDQIAGIELISLAGRNHDFQSGTQRLIHIGFHVVEMNQMLRLHVEF